MLGYTLGPIAYRPWYLELHISLRDQVAVETIHPRAMNETLTQHIRQFFSNEVTNDIKSFRERGGSVGEYIQRHQLVTRSLIETLKENSSRRILQEVLARSSVPQVLTPARNSGVVQGKSQGKSHTKDKAKNPKKNLASLKGYCLHWLQHNQSPCQGPKCGAGNASSLLHKTEWDTCPGDARTKILAAAKLFCPGVTFKVQP